MSQPIKNPFQSPDPLQPWFSGQQGFVQKKGLEWKRYVQTRGLRPNILYSFMTLYSQFKLFTTNHIAAAITIFFLIFSATFAASAEAFAPSEFKPSAVINTLFKSNQIPQKDPYTSLSPDNDYNVIDIAKCDLAMKYPRSIEGADVNPSDYSLIMDGPDSDRIGAVLFYGFPASGANDEITLGKVHVECYKSEPVREAEGNPYHVNTEPTNLSPAQLREKFGWFITEGDISNIQLRTQTLTDGFLFDYSNVEEAEITFQYKGIYYSIYGMYTVGDPQVTPVEGVDAVFKGSTKGLYLNQIQFQFQSLVKNETNVSLDTPEKPLTEIKITPEVIATNPTPTPKPTTVSSLSSEVRLKNEDVFEKSITQQSECISAGVVSYSNFIDRSRMVVVPASIVPTFRQEEIDKIKKDVSEGYDAKTPDLVSRIFQQTCSGSGANPAYPITDIQYPNVDSYTLWVASTGQVGPGFLTIYLNAIKGGSLINLSKTLDLPSLNEYAPNYENCIAKFDYSKYEELQKCVFDDFFTPSRKAEIRTIAQQTLDEYQILP